MTRSPRNRPTRTDGTARPRADAAATRTADAGRGRKRWYAGGAIALAAIALALVVATGGSGTTKQASTGQAGEDRAFELLNGGSGTFEAYRGKPLVVNFFASWCTPCLAELPGFERVGQDLQGQVGFLGVNLQDSVRAGQRVVEQTGITFTVARDPDGKLFQSFGAVAMPTTVFIDAGGKVVDVNSGELSADELRDRIDKVLLS
ncbi:MAG: TlpA family protein disulfide reductase [Actinobacteria bacterium]|nr:TlpA family protein disulfide reductase [Actinomycetota bacterium]